MAKGSSRRKATSPKATSVAVRASLSYRTKQEALTVYVDQLVQKKLSSKKKQRRLNKSEYKEIHLKLLSIGINWLTLNALKFRVLRAFNAAVKSMSCPPPPGVDTSNTNTSSTQLKTPIPFGRKKGTSKVAIKEKQLLHHKAKEKVTELYFCHYQKYRTKSNKKRSNKGTYVSIFNKVKHEMKLDDSFKFSYESCRSRIRREKLFPNGIGCKSPLIDVEPKFIEIILSMSDIGCPVSVGETICLLQSLINNTPAQERLKDFQRKIFHARGHYDVAEDYLGTITKNYYYGFMRRYQHIIQSSRGRRFEVARQNWTNYTNFSNMYIDIERMLVESKLAITLPEPFWMNREGVRVEDVKESYGCKVQTDFTFPQCCIVMDEVGGDLNMMNDGFIGGKKFLCRTGDTAKMNATKKTRKFTLLGVTNMIGDPIMCVVIFEGKERNILMESGIDPMHPKCDSFDWDSFDAENNYDIFMENFGTGKLFPGGPVCEFEGIKIPTMVRYSDKGSITGAILRDILQTIDELNVFQSYRDKGVVPFLLVDGHQSRFHTDFLKYITNNEHRWKVSIGVPYGTSLWQVGDSPQQNGRYKVGLSEAKKMFIEKRIQNFCSEMELLSTDIIPMINFAWSLSFADKHGNKQAISQRGFYPLNKNLLLRTDLRRTMTVTDKEQEDDLHILTQEKLSIIGSSTYHLEHPLNFNCGYASTVIDSIVGAVDLQRARARNNAKAKIGANSKLLIKKMKKLTSAGQLVRVANTHEIGLSLLEEIKLRKGEMEKIDMEVAKKKQAQKFETMDRYVNLKESKKEESNWNNSDYKVAIKALKKDKDGKTPTKKADMVEFWDRIKHRERFMIIEHKSLCDKVNREDEEI